MVMSKNICLVHVWSGVGVKQQVKTSHLLHVSTLGCVTEKRVCVLLSVTGTGHLPANSPLTRRLMSQATMTLFTANPSLKHNMRVLSVFSSHPAFYSQLSDLSRPLSRMSGVLAGDDKDHSKYSESFKHVGFQIN